jgi:hypothetical protein
LGAGRHATARYSKVGLVEVQLIRSHEMY